MNLGSAPASGRSPVRPRTGQWRVAFHQTLAKSNSPELNREARFNAPEAGALPF